MKSIDQQIRAMADQWPEFALAATEERSATWEGTLAPDKREHVVRIRYRAPLAIEHITLNQVQPRVQIIQPLLERHLDYEEGPVPHTYVNERQPELPYLCLFSPSGREWDLDDLIAETTVFWAARWLLFYEGWLLTRKWLGEGRHPGVRGSAQKRKQLEEV